MLEEIDNTEQMADVLRIFLGMEEGPDARDVHELEKETRAKLLPRHITEYFNSALYKSWRDESGSSVDSTGPPETEKRREEQIEEQVAS
jgi:hypothetical protein